MDENIISQNKSVFMSWLSEKIKFLPVSEYLHVYKEIEDFCLKTKIIKKSLFEEFDINTAIRVKKTIESNKIFRFKHKKDMATYMVAVKYYLSYIKELEESKNVDFVAPPECDEKELAKRNDFKVSNQYPTFYEHIYNALKELSEKYEDSVSVISIANHINYIVKLNVIKEILDQVSWAKADGKKYIFCGDISSTEKLIESSLHSVVTSDVVQPQSEMGALIVDFNNELSLSFTKPVSFTYFGNYQQDIKSWTDLYVQLISFIYNDYKESFSLFGNVHVGVSFSAKENGRIDLVHVETPEGMRAPKKLLVDENIYLETNLSATNIVDKIKWVLDELQIPYEGIVICYEKKAHDMIKEIYHDKNSQRLTIREAIKIVMEKADEPLSSEDVYDLIIESNLYVFGAQNPVNVVNITINAACVGSGYKHRARQDLYGFIVENGEKKYYLLNRKDELNIRDTIFKPSNNFQETNISGPTSRRDASYEKGFVEWMQKKGMAEPTIRSYTSSIRSAEWFAKANGIYGVYLTSNDTALVLASIDILLSNKWFIDYNQQQHNRFSAAFRKLRDYIAEIERHHAQKTSDTELEVKNSVLYHKLYSVSKVFDDPRGLTVDYILDIIGAICSKEELIEFLDRISWTTKLSEELYTFAQNITPVVDEQEPVIDENIETEPTDFDKEAFIRVLMNRFQSGMQFDSIDLENFRDTYSLMFDVDLSFTDEELEKRLKYCGVIYQDRLFPAEGIIDNNTKERLFSYIDNKFAAGNKVLYYKAIFTDLSDAFVYCFSLTDEHMLKAYIEFMTDGNFYFYDDYMSVEKDVEIDHSSEIVAFMLNAGKPLSYDEVYEGLSHISKDIIYNEIRSNSKFLMNEKEHYFHIDIFEFSEADGAAIAEILNIEIENNGYVIWSQIFETVKEKLPIFIENNYYLSSLGIRNALSRFMSEQFNFSSDVISASGVSLGMVEVYRLFAKNNAPFSDTALYNFSKITDPVINFWSVAQETVRVSKTLFVAKNEVNFDVEAVDKALETYLTSGYILVKDVDSFLVFPNVGYEWNTFLLENFLLHYSKKFCLVNNGTSLNNVAGAIAKKNGEFTQFVDICAHALADSGIELKKTEALNYLADINLITRRSYRDIEIAMNRARQIRNRKG